jgi:hypothetical protein
MRMRNLRRIRGGQWFVPLRISTRSFSLWLIAGLLAAPLAPARRRSRASSSSEELVNWYYAATFGTGIYTLGDRTVAVLQLP